MTGGPKPRAKCERKTTRSPGRGSSTCSPSGASRCFTSIKEGRNLPRWYLLTSSSVMNDPHQPPRCSGSIAIEAVAVVNGVKWLRWWQGEGAQEKRALEHAEKMSRRMEKCGHRSPLGFYLSPRTAPS